MLNPEKDKHLNDIIGRLIVATDPDEIQEIYRDWADSYDGDLDQFGYVAPEIGSSIFAQALMGWDRLILDAGCGTGLVGEKLRNIGYQNIHGTDFSQEMLDKAEKTGVYRSIFRSDFFQALSLESNLYDGIISIGVYSSRMRETFLPEMIRILKPGGIICLSARLNYYQEELAEQLAGYVAQSLITIEMAEERPYMLAQNANAMYLVLKKRVT